MATDTTPPEVTPDRTDVVPGSYAVYVDERHIHVWQYRVGLSDPDGEWFLMETHDRTDDPKLTMEHATPTSPTADGYWIHSRTYDCELDCE